MEKENKNTCGRCARFKVPNSGCPWSEDIRKGVITRSDKGCDEFYAVKTKEAKVKKNLRDSGLTIDGCFEAIYSDGKPRFLVKNSEIFGVVESLEIDDEKVFPKESRNVPYEPYGVYPGSVSSKEDLFRKVLAEFESFIDIEGIWKEVFASCVLLSYQQEKLQTLPYLFLYGDNESGKSTVLQVLKFLCYRPMYGVTIPSADLYGYLEDSNAIGTILEDEVQGINKDNDKLKIYKAGYKQGAVVPRTIMTKFDRIIKYYRTFCFKGCAGEQIPQVKGFNERFVFVPMVEGFPQKEWADVNKADLARLYDLRNMLLKWRMQTRTQELPEIELPIKGRLKELWKPLLQVTHELSVYEKLFSFVEDQRKERLSTRQNTLEGKIVKVVTEIFNDAEDNSLTAPFQRIWTDLREELDGKVDEKKPNVMDTSEFFQVTKNKVGYRLREILTGRTKVLRQKDPYGNWVSTKAYEFDPAKLRRVAQKYGFEFVTKLPRLLSSESVFKPESMESMEKIDGDNVEKEPYTLQELGKLGNGVTDSSSSISSKNQKEESTGGEKSPDSVTTESIPGVDERVCGQCASWHKTSCSYSEGEPSCVTPLNRYAADCKDFSVLNSPSNLRKAPRPDEPLRDPGEL